MMFSETTEVVACTRRWLEKAVIGLGLCPFAAPVLEKNQIRFAVSEASNVRALDSDLKRELLLITRAFGAKVDGAAAPHPATTLLICPNILTTFMEFNLYLAAAEKILRDLKLTGVIQIATFHPDYQFAENASDAVENFTNRAPYPILHLLRESDVEEALENFPDADGIYRRNQETMRRVGRADLEKMLSDIKGETAK